MKNKETKLKVLPRILTRQEHYFSSNTLDFFRQQTNIPEDSNSNAMLL